MESASKKQIPCLEGLFTMPPEEPRLIGNRCKSCGSIFFPKSTSCRNPYCSKTEPMEELLFGNRGKLFTFTVNHYQPPPPYHSPDPFVPYTNGWIEVPEGLTVHTMIAPGYDEKNLKIGMEMELIIDKLYEDEQGNEVVSWKFKPAAS
ncbi:Zn-ribbon domain-containing OB-fold protein [Chloroflexota bacterium]